MAQHYAQPQKTSQSAARPQLDARDFEAFLGRYEHDQRVTREALTEIRDGVRSLLENLR